MLGVSKYLVIILGVVVLGAIILFLVRSSSYSRKTVSSDQSKVSIPVLDNPSKSSVQNSSLSKPIRDLQIEVHAQNSSQSGTAKFSTVINETLVVIDLKNVPKNATESAQIYEGSCTKLGKVKYSLTSFKNGFSKTVLSLPLITLMKDLPLAVGVYKAEKKSHTLVSCGEIKV